jgi:hypothetical protein
MLNVVVPLAVTVAGLKLQVLSDGKPEQLKETAPLKPSSAAMVIAMLVELPGVFIPNTVLDSDRAKSG